MTPEPPRPRELSPRRRLLVELSAAVASGADAEVEEAADRAAAAARTGDVERGEVEETLLQSYLFVGYPAALAAMEAWRERVPGPPPEPDPLARPDDLGAWESRGEDVCRRVYGPAYGALREKVGALHPALDRWTVTEGYGKVLGRPGLDLTDRELCIAAILAVRGRAPQLHSHLRGALRAGADVESVEAALELALRRAPGDGRAERAREVWGRVRARARQKDDGERPGPPNGGDGEDG